MCERSVLAANDGSVLELGGQSSGAIVPKKLKHLSAQPAKVLQSPIALSHGMLLSLAGSGIDAAEDFDATAAPPTAGSMATEKAIIAARITRIIAIRRLELVSTRLIIIDFCTRCERQHNNAFPRQCG